MGKVCLRQEAFTSYNYCSNIKIFNMDCKHQGRGLLRYFSKLVMNSLILLNYQAINKN